MEITRSYGYYEEDPCMFVHRKIDPDNRKFAIAMKDLWHFSEEHNPLFIQEMYRFAYAAYRHLGIGDFLVLSDRSKGVMLGKIAACIQEGIEEVLMMKPHEWEEKPKVIGEGIFTVNGKSKSFEVTDRAE